MFDTHVNPFVSIIELINQCCAILVPGEMAGGNGIVNAQYSFSKAFCSKLIEE